MKYELRRWRFREVCFDGDEGPEGGRFRYDISLGVFDDINECFKTIASIEGVSTDKVYDEIKYCGRYNSEWKPLGVPSLYEYYNIKGEYIGKVPAVYWDEYHIESYENES